VSSETVLAFDQGRLKSAAVRADERTMRRPDRFDLTFALLVAGFAAVVGVGLPVLMSH
jgi:hypothetical protein